MSLRGNAGFTQVEDQDAVEVDLWADEFDRVGWADAEFGYETECTDDPGTSTALVSDWIGVWRPGVGGLEAEALVETVEHYQVSLG